MNVDLDIIERTIIKRLRKIGNHGGMMSIAEYTYSEDRKLDEQVDKCIKIVQDVFAEYRNS